MIKYKIVEPVRILHNGKTYQQGDELLLSEADAANLGVYAKRLDKVAERVPVDAQAKEKAPEANEIPEAIDAEDTAEADTSDAAAEVPEDAQATVKPRRARKGAV